MKRHSRCDDDENSDFLFLPHEEIIANITREIQNSGDKNGGTSQKVSNKKAINSLDMCLLWKEENELPLHEIVLLCRIFPPQTLAFQ